MTYTLATWALWMVAAALIGAVVGWMLRGLRRAETSPRAPDDTDTWVVPDAPLRPADVGPDAAVAMPTYPEEVERLRAKVAELEGVVVERNRLQWEIEELRAATSAASARSAAQPTAPAARVEATGDLVAQRDEWASKAVAYEQLISELRVRLWNSEARLADLHATMRSSGTIAPAATAAPPTPDLEAGALVLGPSLRLDDLTVVEGIGPKIADLCHARGITTWWALANTSVDTLREVLTAAGPKFQVHDPSSWPEQARLLATGQWVAFQTFTERLRAGRPG